MNDLVFAELQRIVDATPVGEAVSFPQQEAAELLVLAQTPIWHDLDAIKQEFDGALGSVAWLSKKLGPTGGPLMPLGQADRQDASEEARNAVASLRGALAKLSRLL